MRTKFWSLRKTSIAGICKFMTNCINGIGMQSKLFGDTATKLSQIKMSGSPYRLSGPPSISGFSVDLAAIIPDKIDGASLSAERASCGRASVFNSISVCENHITFP